MKTFFCLMFFFINAHAFSPKIPYQNLPNVFLNGKINQKLCVYYVPRDIGYKYLKKYQILEIATDGPVSVCAELDSARELLRSPRKDLHVSFLMSEDPYEHLFTIIYRISKTFPRVYSVEGLTRTPNNHNSISVTEVERMLKQMCNNRKGFLQTQGLKYWAGGKYKVEKYLENQF